MNSRLGILYLVSGPSGSGKTTLCERIAKENEAYYAISCTTRDPRKGEIHKTDYFFLTLDDFKKRLSNGDFLESAEVHGNLYGTLRSEVLLKLQSGIDVVMDIDVQGADSVRKCDDPIISQSLVDLFVMPESKQELQNRLINRQTDSEEIIQKRMKNALMEIEQCHKYTYLLLSKDKETDYIKFKSLLIAERLKQTRHQLSV